MGFPAHSDVHGDFYLTTDDKMPWPNTDPCNTPYDGVYVGQRPTSDPNYIRFFLWTEDNREKYEILSIDDANSITNSHFDPSKDTKVLIHGYTRCGNDGWVQEAKDAFLSLTDENLNIISVDWQALAGPGPHYIKAAENTYTTGKHTAKFIKFLADTVGADPKSFHPIGFSLGGQVAGSVGHHMQMDNGVTLPRVSGLDPAGPTFMKMANSSHKLSPDDAEFVDVIYTTNLWIGTHEVSGHVNFYPNGGRAPQPGCEGKDGASLTCSHHRAPDTYIESINAHANSELGLQGMSCWSWDQFEKGECDPYGSRNWLGYYADKNYPGSFYLRTNDEPPYAISMPDPQSPPDTPPDTSDAKTITSSASGIVVAFALYFTLY